MFRIIIFITMIDTDDFSPHLVAFVECHLEDEVPDYDKITLNSLNLIIMDIFIDTFPVLVAFENLDMLENLQIAKKVLNGQTGIYAFVHIPTGSIPGQLYWFNY